ARLDQGASAREAGERGRPRTRRAPLRGGHRPARSDPGMDRALPEHRRHARRGAHSRGTRGERVNPFAYLGLPRDADERSIKRAYAQRLREVRPDTDAEGFQALHSAYKAALELCRRRPAAHAVAVREVNELVAVDVEDVARSEPTVSVTWPMPASAAPAAGMPLAVLADAEEIAVPPSGPQVTVAWSMPTLEARPLASPAPIPEPVV